MEEVTRIGKYQIVREIARSSITSVYEALQPPLERKVLIKRLYPELTTDPEIRARFEREARALGRIKHPNIVHIYDFQVSPRSVYIVTEWISGGSIADLLKKHGPLGEREAAAIALDVIEGLAVAHGAGIIHRDIKPGNLLISSGGSIRVSDFGLAQFEGSPALTQQGMVIGTPAYMAPETVTTGKADQKSDLYSFGVTLYEIMTGANPFMGKNISETFSLILNYKPTPLTGIGQGLQKLLMSLLEKRPEKRPETEQALAEVRELAVTLNVKRGWRDVDLSLAAGEADNQGNGSGIQPRLRAKPPIVVVITALALAVMVLVLVFYANWRNPAQVERENTPGKDTIALGLTKPESLAVTIDSTTAGILSASGKSSAGQNRAETSAVKQQKPSPKGGVESSEQADNRLSARGNQPVDSSRMNLSEQPRLSANSESLRVETPGESLPSGLSLNGRQVPKPPAGEGRRGSGYLRLNVKPWATVYYEGQPLVQTPYTTPIKLPAGEVTLTLIADKLPPITRTFTIAAGDTLRAEVDLLNYVGIIEFIEASPWAQVYLDGNYLGRTPLGNQLFLPFGVHKLLFRHPNYPDHVETIEFHEGSPPRTIYVDMTATPG